MNDTAGLCGLRPIWQELEAGGAKINPFLSWEWQWSWWEAFGGGRRPRCLVVRDAEAPVGILPLYSESGAPGLLRFGGGVDLSDHLGFVHLPGRADQVAAAALAWLFGEDDLSSGSAAGVVQLELHFLLQGSESLRALQAAAAGLDLAQELSEEEVSPRIELPNDFELYLTGRLNKKDRHELRRKLHRLDAERPGWRQVTETELGLDRALDEFFRLLRSSGPHKTEFFTPDVESFVRRASERLHDRGWLRVQFIEAGGDLIAATHGFTVASTWHLYNSGYDVGLAALSPGLICVAEGVRAAIAEGCTRADFLRGNEGYKYHLGAVDRPLLRLQILAPKLGSAGR